MTGCGNDKGAIPQLQSAAGKQEISNDLSFEISNLEF
jgi:hypothetical protein